MVFVIIISLPSNIILIYGVEALKNVDLLWSDITQSVCTERVDLILSVSTMPL